MNGRTYEYAFSYEEIKNLALLLRKSEAVMPAELRGFFSFVETLIYDSMTIEEAERFFNVD